MNFKKQTQIKKNSAVNSAALQDHMMKKYNFNLDTKISAFSQKSMPSQVPRRRKTVQKLPKIIQKMNIQIEKLQNLQKNSILPYKNQNLTKLKEAKQDQIKMNKYKKNLTLAQKLGLVEAPPLPLTASDWQAIQQKSKARNDAQNCCSICLQDFKLQQQVLLSCSHVFHAQCLQSYQRHNKIKCCPICRRKDYQKKQIDQALKLYTLKCILRIQRVYRGSCTRIYLYNKLLIEGYIAKSPRFKRRLLGFKMWKFSIKFQNNIKKQEHYFNSKINKLQEKYQKQKQDILAAFVQLKRKKLLETKQVQQKLQELGLCLQMPIKKDQVDWQKVKKRGIQRQQKQCAICLMPLWKKKTYLLSCSHLFHVNCIQGLQRYTIQQNKSKCPCCRQRYTKKILQIKQ